MRKQVMLGLVGVLALVGSVAPAGAQVKRPVRAQTYYDDTRGVNYAVTYEVDGGRRLSAESPDLQFHKTSYQDGHFELRLASGGDVVTFTVSHAGVQVTRGRRAARIVLGAAQEQDFDQVRSLIAGSRAVKRFRQLAAVLEQSEENTPPLHATLIGAAIVGALDGDPGAAPRIARRLARQKTPGGATLRKAAFYEDCWETYSYQVNAAWEDFVTCMSPARWWNYDAYDIACTFVWTIRVEGAWFQYLGCSAIPGIVR